MLSKYIYVYLFIGHEAANTDLYDLVSVPCPERPALIGVLQELWSGGAGHWVPAPPPTTQQTNIGGSQAERTFHLGTAKTVTRGELGGKWIEFYVLPPLSLHCTYAITKEEMPTTAAAATAAVNKRTKAAGITDFTVSQMALQPIPALPT